MTEVSNTVDVLAVPTTRKVNDKDLSSDLTLTHADVKAAPTGYGIGEAIPANLTGDRNLDAFAHNGFRTYNGDAGDKGGPALYGTCLDFGHIGNGMNYPGWAGQLFLDNAGTLFSRCNDKLGSFGGSKWAKHFTTAAPPTAAECGAVAKSGDTMAGPLTAQRGQKAAVSVMDGASVRYVDGGYTWFHEYSLRDELVWGSGGSGENLLASLTATGRYTAKNIRSEGKVEALGATTRGWTDQGVAAFVKSQQDVGEAELIGLTSTTLHYPDHHTLEYGHGVINYRDSSQCGHTLWTTDGAGFVSPWIFRNDGHLDTPGGWGIYGDGSLYGDAWGGKLSDWVARNYSSIHHTHDIYATNDWTVAHFIQALRFTEPVHYYTTESSSMIEHGSGYVLTGTNYAEYENRGGNTMRQIQILKAGVWVTVGY